MNEDSMSKDQFPNEDSSSSFPSSTPKDGQSNDGDSGMRLSKLSNKMARIPE